MRTDDPPCPPVQTARIRLRCVRPGDAIRTSEMMTSAVSRWLAYWPVPFTLEMAESRIAWARDAARERKHLPFAAERLSDGALLGWVMVNRAAGCERRGTFGYWLGEEHHGQGYMREVAPAVLEAGFRLLDLDVIGATVHPDNPASLAVMRGCGMQRVGEGMMFMPARDREEFCWSFERARPPGASVP
ncbi:MAG: GNAT family N-acetyltransferase [Acetobacteraceae bacterium]|nr:GNAT family N-acetyltransferase [Acetobacteraceae bacterium]